MSRMHITIGTVDDGEYLDEAISDSGFVVWPVPKTAAIGDTVLFLVPAFTGEIIATGKVQDSPIPSENWAPKYEAPIASVVRRMHPIPLELLRSSFPDWKYPTYARTYTTVPDEYVGGIEELLRIDRPFDTEFGTSPDELGFGFYFEGTVHEIIVNAYERNIYARKECIEHYGAKCSVCEFTFGQMYGEIAEGLIQVHHLTPLSEIAEEYEVDPIADLRPVCPNCHAVLHRRSPPYSIKELKAIIRKQARNRQAAD